MKSLQTASLHTLDNAELLDLIKNNSGAGVAQGVQDSILQILTNRGVDKDTIQRFRPADSNPFDKAQKHYLAFKRSSRRVFFCYLTFAGALTISFLLDPHWMVSTALLLIFGSLISFVIDTLLQQKRFYKVVGGARSYSTPLVFFFLGMPLYFLMFLSFKQKMEARLEHLA